MAGLKFLFHWVQIFLDTCDSAVDLRSISSPFYGSTRSARNDYSTCSGSGRERIFYLDMQPGEALTIGQTYNTFDSVHQLAYGGPCPGNTNIACRDDPDTERFSWTNEFQTVERVYFMIDGYSTTSRGSFILEWTNSTGNKLRA